MKWFKHDSDAHRDFKLKKVIMKYGMEGYGLYWHCLELIVNNVSSDNITFELEHDSEVISHDTGIHRDRVEEMITFMVDLSLFENNMGVVTCLKLAKRLDQSMVSSPQMRKLVDEIRNNHDSIMTMSCKTRLDKTRLDKKKTKRFAPPTEKEVRQYCEERKNGVDPKAFINHYEASNWFRGKTKISDWKACVRTWEGKSDKSEDKIDRAMKAIQEAERDALRNSTGRNGQDVSKAIGLLPEGGEPSKKHSHDGS